MGFFSGLNLTLVSIVCLLSSLHILEVSKEGQLEQRWATAGLSLQGAFIPSRLHATVLRQVLLGTLQQAAPTSPAAGQMG